MTGFRGKNPQKGPAARGTFMIIDQVTAGTCTDAADFASDDTFANMLFSNVTVNISEISSFDTRYGNIRLQKTKKVDSETLFKRWNIYLGNTNKTVTQTTQNGV